MIRHAIRRKAKVLVVEDSFLLAGDLCEFLRSCGYEPVGPAHRVDEAAKLLKDHRIDAAILDIMLGGRPCFPLCDHLERWNVPFLFLTGSDITGIPSTHRHVPLLSKPFDRALLKRTLDGLLALPAAA